MSPHLNGLDSLRGLWDCIFLNKKCDQAIEQNLCTMHYRLTNVARTSLGMIADTVSPPKDKKIALPAFICAVVATPFLSRGYEIEWIDTDEWGVMDREDFRRKASDVGLVVVPYIFGRRPDFEAIYAIAQERDIFVVKDSAHAWDTDTRNCDAVMMSFGREKYLSCVSGGALLWPEDSPYAEGFRRYPLRKASVLWQVRHGLQPLWFSIGFVTWPLGKAFLALLSRLRVLPRAVTHAEKAGREDMPMASLGRWQRAILARQMQQRSRIESRAGELSVAWKAALEQVFPNGNFFTPENNFRVVMKTGQAGRVRERAAELGFLLREWDGEPIAPRGVSLPAFGYTKGSCPKAEAFARGYVTWPINRRVGVDAIAFLRDNWKA